MKTVLTAEVSKANDRYTIVNHNITEKTLIHQAATAVLNTLQDEGYDLQSPCILCGNGNNGADGMELACLLKEIGADVTVLYLGPLTDMNSLTRQSAQRQSTQYDFDAELIGTPQTANMSEQCQAYYKKVVGLEIPVLTALPKNALSIDHPAFSVFVDAVYGTGMQGEITDPIVRETFYQINHSTIPVVAVDIPSGAHCDTGALDPNALYAGQTISMQGVKLGHLLFPAAEYAGVVTVADIGIEIDPTYQDRLVHTIEEEDLETMLPARPVRSNKGTFGRVLIICGSTGMAGAAHLAAQAAYRAGAGLVEILTPAKNRTILQQLVPEAILTCYTDFSKLRKVIKAAVRRADAIVVGCGIGRSKMAKYCVQYVLKKSKVSVVMDADALNIAADKPALLKRVNKLKKPQIVITPHPAEAARLIDKKMTPEKVLENVFAATELLCDKYKVNVLLKDAHSLIYSHDKQLRYINLPGSTALATAGSGDILAGLIGGLAAAKTNEHALATTTALAAYLHGKAGEAAEEKVGSRAAMARDILDGLANRQ